MLYRQNTTTSLRWQLVIPNRRFMIKEIPNENIHKYMLINGLETDGSQAEVKTCADSLVALGGTAEV